MNEEGEAHGWGAIRWDDGDDYDGVFKHGELNGRGTYTRQSKSQFLIEFEEGKPVGKGEMYENFNSKKEMIVYDVEFDGSGMLEDCAPTVKQRKRLPDYKEAMIPVCGMLSGPSGGPSSYDHIHPVSGELIWARPSRADYVLFNAEDCRGKIVLVRRGGTDFTRKLSAVQAAGGAICMVVVGFNPDEKKYQRPICCVHTGAVGGDDLPPELRSLECNIPVIYILKCLECEPLNTHFKSRRDCKIGILGGDFALYEFRMSFGDVTWMISKRYSEFDALDNVLNTKYGLPPVGLPPKQWFGLRDPNVIQSRHDGFNLYLNDCIKRPVLVLSPELQSFCEMPEEVINSFKKN
ncbi:hypothetical protein GUITHDRAFT_99376 [Guillardia theta CCMP2712]|uniref:PX domain-containing protein n=1 Tax=Guillardia theta (strain CCMP2712) TaxID=905079 RepID=L1K2N5_GUITC|nr:hypothetical protein GUITHDRAFT_99376 [Guillardia theta CCMP2712]EKX54720.1 hypothetical protein GUITHDRAFT_99376 [Guillardia theta CCMP2712]|eukprot:XP_005841700.1 hypothetical protein GUITHDRAFT_99376 [Guillardia theta CCMP2712]